MKSFFLSILCLLFSMAVFGLTPVREFYCSQGEGDQLTPPLHGVYLGETLDAVRLTTNEEYGVFEKDKKKYDEFITLNRTHKKRPKRITAKYPIQFSVTEKDDLGSKTTVLAIPLGVFSGPQGYRFSAFLESLSEESPFTLNCILD